MLVNGPTICLPVMAPPLPWQPTSCTPNCASSMAPSCSHGFKALCGDDEYALFRSIRPDDQLDETCCHIGSGGRGSHALDEIGRGNAEIVRIPCNRMLP